MAEESYYAGKVQQRYESEQFRRRKITVFKYASSLTHATKAKVYVLIERNGRLFTLNTSGSSTWPPSAGEVVSHHLRCHGEGSFG
jgi:hypothetical protein